MKRKAIIVGSAPISAKLSDADLSKYHRIAINKSWQLRNDFQSHVYLRSLKEKFMPPPARKMTSVTLDTFTNILNKSGGLYLTSGSVSLIAGYWATFNIDARFISYYGCDLVFDTKGDDGATHFYGKGDEGPLFGNFKYNLRQEERSLRLFIWALMHRVILTNSSALNGSKLCFPKLGLDEETNDLYQRSFESTECADLLRHGGAAIGFEAENRTQVFYQKQKLFEADENAQAAMNAILDHWAGLRPAVDAFNAKFSELAAS